MSRTKDSAELDDTTTEEPPETPEAPADEAAPDAPAPATDLPAGQPDVVEEAVSVQETTDTPPEIPAGHRRVTYKGIADLIEYGAYKFRPDQPVIVPSDVVEELLTWPNERFELVPEPEADEE